MTPSSRRTPLLARLSLACLVCACATPRPAPSESATPRPPASPNPPPAENIPTEPPPAEATEPQELTKLRERARAVLREQALLLWKHWTTGEEIDVAATQRGTGALYSVASVQQVRAARAGLAGDAARALHRLELHLAGELLARETAPQQHAVAEAEAAAVLDVGGTRHPWRDLDRLLAGEASAAERAALTLAETPVLARLAPAYEARRARVAEVSSQLGWASPAAFGAELRDSTPAALAALAEETLASTEDLYFRTMERLAVAELGLPLAKLRRGDLPRLLRTPRVDAGFPADGAMPAARAVFESLGLPLESLTGLTLDLDPRPTRSPRPLALPIDPPDDVRFSLKPTGGLEEWRAVLHELAHAQQSARVTRPEWELRQLAPAAGMEAAGFLFESLAGRADWLERATKLDDRQRARLVQVTAARRLFLLRRTAAQLLFDLGRSDGTFAADPAAAWRRLVSRAWGFELTEADAARHAVEHDPLFAAADYLQAWCLAGQLERHLTRADGARWWESPASGAVLAAAWAEGGAPTVAELARRFGAERLGPAALVELLARRLGP